MNYIPSQLTQEVSYIKWADKIDTTALFLDNNYPDLSNDIPFTSKTWDNNCLGLVSNWRAIEFPHGNDGVLSYKWVWATPDIINTVENTKLGIQSTIYPDETFNRNGLWLCSKKEAIDEKEWADFLINRWVKTAPIAGIYELKAITLSNKEKKSTKYLRNSWLLPYSSVQTVIVRHQETSLRVWHFMELLSKNDNTDLIKMKKNHLPGDLNKYFSDFSSNIVYSFFPLILEWYKVSSVDGHEWAFAFMNNLWVYWEKLDVWIFSKTSFDFSQFTIDTYITFILSEFNKIATMLSYYKKALNLKWTSLNNELKPVMLKSIFKLRIESLIWKTNDKPQLLSIIKNSNLLIDKLLESVWLK